MVSLRRASARRRLVVAGATALSALAGIGVGLPRASGPAGASAASIASLQQQIDAGRGRIARLSGAVGAAAGEAARIAAHLAPVEANLAAIQRDLDLKRGELLAVQTKLAAARARLDRLQTMQARSESVLARQLLSSYEADRPDLIGVVLESRGFTDLLERISFSRRIRAQDARVVAAVRRARREVSDEATRLGALEVRAQTLTRQLLGRRDELARVRLALATRQLAALQARNARAAELGGARSRVGALRDRLAAVEAAQARAAAAQSGSTFGPIQVASAAGFTFPMPKGAAVSPAGWTPDQGVDISAPGHTPLLAVGSGTIVLHGIGGFGPSAPVLHLDSGDYVYYGHAGPGNWTAVGTHVSAGQVISEVGDGIVGISTGPHLEIGFCDASGTPLGPQTAGRMMSLLQSAYGG